MLTEDLANKFNAIKTIASSSFQDVIQKSTSLDNYLLDSMSNSVTSYLDAWLVNHPVLYWLVNHPVISLLGSLITVILIVRLLVTIYRAIANMIDRMWLWILQSPFSLLKFLFGWEVKSKTVSPNTTITNYEVTNNPEQLQEIMTRLDKIQQQQQQILQDIAELKRQSPIINPKQIKLAAPQVISKQ